MKILAFLQLTVTFKIVYLFIYLAVPGLSCGAQHLLAVASELLAAACGI